jgi:hypothetical protein
MPVDENIHDRKYRDVWNSRKLLGTPEQTYRT